MAIAFDAAANGGNQETVSSVTYSHTCTGLDRLLAVGVAARDTTSTDRQASTVTYNAVSMTEQVEQTETLSANMTVSMWYLVAPATGANNVVVTMGGTCAWVLGGSVSLTGVNQSSPVDASNGAGASAAPSTLTVDVTTVTDNAWVVDVRATGDLDVATSVGAGQTQAVKVAMAPAGTQDSAGMSYEGPKTPAGAVTMSWNPDPTSSQWAIAGVAFKPMVGWNPLLSDARNKLVLS